MSLRRHLQTGRRLSAQPGPPPGALPVHGQATSGPAYHPDQLVGGPGPPTADAGPFRRYASASPVTSAAAPAATSASGSGSGSTTGAASATAGSAAAAVGSDSTDSSA